MINVFSEPGEGFSVWTDTEVGPKDGRCLGLDKTRREALLNAKRELNDDLHSLNVEILKIFES